MSSATMTITGFAARDAEIRYTPSGQAVTSVTVPHTPRRRNPQTGQWEDAGDTLWVEASIWGNQAEPAAEAILKGTQVIITGTPRLNVYTKRDGTQGASLRLMAQEWGIRPNNRTVPAKAPTGGSWDAPTGGSMDDPWGNPNLSEVPF